jgi:hypothetical protein
LLCDGITEGAIAGATAGVVVETALYPIDTIKTRLQVNGAPCCRYVNCSIDELVMGIDIETVFNIYLSSFSTQTIMLWLANSVRLGSQGCCTSHNLQV